MALEEVVKELAIPTTAADEMVGGGRREDGGGGVELRRVHKIRVRRRRMTAAKVAHCWSPS